MRRRRTIGAGGLVLAMAIATPGASPWACGQTPGPGGATAAAAPAPSAAQVLGAIQARYRAGPTCERMQIEVKSASGRTSRSWLVVRLNPRPAASVLLELGPLRIAADGRELAAVHERNPLTCFRAALSEAGEEHKGITTSLLLRHLPTLPLPQLDLLTAADVERLPLLAGYAREVRWIGAEPDPRGGGRVIVEGSADRAKVTLVARPGAGAAAGAGGTPDQLHTIEIRDEREVTIRLLFSQVAPCRDEDVRLDVEGRTPVASLGELQPRSGVLRVGAMVPEMGLSSPAGQVQRLKDLYTPPPAYLPAPSADRLVIVFSRRRGGEGEDPHRPVGIDAGRVELPVVAAELRAMQAEVYRGVAPRLGDQPGGAGEPGALLPTFNYVQVMVLEKPPAAEALLKLIAREREAWGSPRSDVDLGEHLAWTTEPKSSVDLFASGTESAAIVVDDRQVLRAVIPINERTTSETLADQLAAALMESVGE